MELLPGVAVLSSGYSHFEGNPDPLTHSDDELAAMDESTHDDFRGGTIADAYVRTGDPN